MRDTIGVCGLFDGNGGVQAAGAQGGMAQGRKMCHWGMRAF